MQVLKKLSGSDGSWEALKQSWRVECASFGEDFETFAVATMMVCEDLAVNGQPRAGVYGLEENDSAFLAICQLNVASIPGYDSPVLRTRYLTLSPLLDFGCDGIERYADVIGTMFFRIHQVSLDEMPSRYIKFHLPSPADRQFFSVLGKGLNDAAVFESVEIHGSWLYITKHG